MAKLRLLICLSALIVAQTYAYSKVPVHTKPAHPPVQVEPYRQPHGGVVQPPPYDGNPSNHLKPAVPPQTLGGYDGVPSNHGRPAPTPYDGVGSNQGRPFARPSQGGSVRPLPRPTGSGGISSHDRPQVQPRPYSSVGVPISVPLPHSPPYDGNPSNHLKPAVRPQTSGGFDSNHVRPVPRPSHGGSVRPYARPSNGGSVRPLSRPSLGGYNGVPANNLRPAAARPGQGRPVTLLGYGNNGGYVRPVRPSYAGSYSSGSRYRQSRPSKGGNRYRREFTGAANNLRPAVPSAYSYY